MKYKVSDKVALTNGDIMTVYQINDTLKWYFMKEDPLNCYTDEMIEGLVERNGKTYPYKIGDRVILKGSNRCATITDLKYNSWGNLSYYIKIDNDKDISIDYPTDLLLPIEISVEEECPQDFIEKYCKSCGTRCDRTKEYLNGCPYYNAYRCTKQNNVIEEETKPKYMGEVSDGYHTFNELYEYRMLYNAALFNEFAKQGLYDVHKSRKHSDGEYPFGDSNWFIVMAELPTGQISNHYEMKDWDKFQIPEKPLANKWDEHSPRDVAERLTSFTNSKKEYPKTYEECCKVLGVNPNNYLSIRNLCCNDGDEDCTNYELGLLGIFDSLWVLRFCRDAYWKLYGEEMGLDKPWEPDWRKERYIIYRNRYDIIGGYREAGCAEHHIFEFPTPVMRDVFKENFGPYIENCKEFL